jgi:CheY-like chemotaxis protein
LCQNYYDHQTGQHARHFRVLDKETTLSTKIDFTAFVKGKLNYALTTLIAANDIQAAQNVQRFLGTPDQIDDGYFASIENSFQPITSSLMLAVETLNAAIAAGTSSPDDFNQYALAIAVALQDTKGTTLYGRRRDIEEIETAMRFDGGEAVRRNPQLKVLYMTGYSRNAIVHQGRLDAGVDLLQKPISSEQLSIAVRKLLDA